MTDWLDFPYPKIPGLAQAGGPPRGKCWAYEKLDGSNLSWPWERGAGFGPCTTRRGIEVRRSQPELGRALSLFKGQRQRWDRLLARARPGGKPIMRARIYCEFFGPLSFAGQHDRKDNNLRLVPVDVALDEGPGPALAGSSVFAELFGVDGPRVLGVGPFSNALHEVGDGEGVVYKIESLVEGSFPILTWIAKQKTESWLARLRDFNEVIGADGVKRTYAEEVQ